MLDVDLFEVVMQPCYHMYLMHDLLVCCLHENNLNCKNWLLLGIW